MKKIISAVLIIALVFLVSFVSAEMNLIAFNNAENHSNNSLENHSEKEDMRLTAFNNSSENSTKNMTYGFCVSEAAKLRNDCYNNQEQTRKNCSETDRQGKDKDKEKICTNDYKNMKSSCKTTFKQAKLECKKIKHSFWDTIRHFFD